jgi:hypothetical protein
MFGVIKEIVIVLRYGLRRMLSGVKQYSDEFYRDGFELLGVKIKKNSTAKLRDFIESTLADAKANVWRDDLCSDERIYGAERLFPEIETLLPIDEMRKQGESYLGCHLPHYFVLAARLQYREGNVGSGGGWHRDSPFTPQFKFIAYLSNVGEENGPFEYVPRTHSSIHKFKSKFSLGKMRFSAEEVKGQWEETSIVVADEGSILIADTKGLHRGRPIRKGKRYACTVYFFENKRGYDNFSSLLQRG